MFSRFSNIFSSNQENNKSNSKTSNQTKLNQMEGLNQAPYQIDNSRSVLEKIASLYAEKLMSDIVLVVGEREFPAHRLILCASSDVFQVMLMDSRWSESQERRIVLQEAVECVSVFELFLQYLYTGRLRVTHSSVLPILALADKYNVKDLISTCIAYMKVNVVSASQKGYLISWLQYTLACAHTDISTVCLNYFKWNVEQVSRYEDFSCCDLDLLTAVLSQHDLVVHDEMTLYNIVVSWLQKQSEKLTPPSSPAECTTTSIAPLPHHMITAPPPPSRRDSSCSSQLTDADDRMEWLTYEVMAYIRFPMMTPRQLADLLLVPLTIKYKEFFVTRMAIGMFFHSGQWDRVKETIRDTASRSNRLLFTPRLYTADQWSASLSVDNLPGLPPYHTRTLVFTTPASASEVDCDNQREWIVELYPKGVWFRKFYLIVWQGTVEVPECVLRSVRLAVTAKDVPEQTVVRVRVAVLVYAAQEGVPYILSVTTTNHIFTPDDNLLNLDHILPFDTLNDPSERKRYLQEPCDSLKIHIVISPLGDRQLCDVT